jgi:hypothetical protein
MTAETQVRFRRAAALALTAALLALAPGASAQVPNTLAYGGFLTDSAGTPYEGRVDVIAELWSGQREGTLLWGETHDGVRVSNGWFGLDLGSEEALDVDWTGTNALYLQLTINGEPIEPRQRVQSVVFAQVAENATGALATLIDEIDDRITTIERDGAGEVRWTDILNRPAGLDDGDDLLIPPIDWTDLDGIPEILEDGEIAWEEIENLPRDIEAMADDSDQLDFVGNDVFFNGVNVHVRNGQGSTTRTNGRGNLIVGYSAGGTGRQRTGSHNLIIGDEHAYAGTAGIVAGTHNDILASNASVLGGSNNTAQQPGAVVLGGNGNDAIGEAATVFGGTGNDAVGAGAVVVGGNNNRADGDSAVVLGGSTNIALGDLSVVAAGTSGRAEGDGSSIAGGFGGFAVGPNSQVLGGNGNRALGNGSVVVGGSENLAVCGYDVAVGGSENVAGAGEAGEGGAWVCEAGDSAAVAVGGSGGHASGAHSATLAGLRSRASGDFATVVGGSDNDASGAASSVVAGFSNQATGERGSVLGGERNEAQGFTSTIIGGATNIAGGVFEIAPTDLGP